MNTTHPTLTIRATENEGQQVKVNARTVCQIESEAEVTQ